MTFFMIISGIALYFLLKPVDPFAKPPVKVKEILDVIIKENSNM